MMLVVVAMESIILTSKEKSCIKGERIDLSYSMKSRGKSFLVPCGAGDGGAHE